MSHVGVALNYPLNLPVAAYLTRRPSEEERETAIRTLERLIAKSPSSALEKSLQKLRDRAPDPPVAPSQSPEEADKLMLGAHPDVIESLWNLGRALPMDCRWVAYRHAALVHPQSGVIFGLAIGTLGVALRLPENADAATLAAGGVRKLVYGSGAAAKTFSALEIGPDWRLFRRAEKIQALVGAAYQAAQR